MREAFRLDYLTPEEVMADVMKKFMSGETITNDDKLCFYNAKAIVEGIKGNTKKEWSAQDQAYYYYHHS